jgi:hypothetical protein
MYNYVDFEMVNVQDKIKILYHIDHLDWYHVQVLNHMDDFHMLNHYDFYNEVNVMKVLLHLMITTFKLKKTEILFFQSIKQTLTIAKL